MMFEKANHYSFLEIKPYLTPSELDYYDLENAIGSVIPSKASLDQDKFLEMVKGKLFCYPVFEWECDNYDVGRYLWVFDDKPFCVYETSHEDTHNYEIINTNVRKELIKLVLNCLIYVNEEDEEDYQRVDNFFEKSLIQMFDSTYNISGRNLLLLNDDGSFSLIEKAWQDRDKIHQDRLNKTVYNDMYYYHKYEVLVSGAQHTVSYKRIIGVLGDSKKLAEKISQEMNLNNPDFKLVARNLGYLDLEMGDRN